MTILKGTTVHKMLALAAAMLMLCMPAAAMAQDSSSRTYSPDTDVLGEVGTVEEQQEQPAGQESAPAPTAAAQPTPAKPVAAQASSPLPFTGTDAFLLAFGGAALLGLGLGLRRFSRTIA